jgi:Cys-rich four helix bundle protein (predicted Tat secretion target)
MQRREVLEVLAAAGFMTTDVALGAEATPGAAAPPAHDHSAATAKYRELIADTSRCVNTGEACVAHCVRLLGEGDKSLGACAKSVQDTIAGCTALRQLAAASTKSTRSAGIAATLVPSAQRNARRPRPDLASHVDRDPGQATG